MKAILLCCCALILGCTAPSYFTHNALYTLDNRNKVLTVFYDATDFSPDLRVTLDTIYNWEDGTVVGEKNGKIVVTMKPGQSVSICTECLRKN